MLKNVEKKMQEMLELNELRMGVRIFWQGPRQRPTLGYTRRVVNGQRDYMYSQYVDFVRPDQIPRRDGYAYTPDQVNTHISYDKLMLMYAATGRNEVPDYELLYANALAHEVLWFGVLEETSDVRTARDGSLSSPTASATELMMLNQAERAAIMHAMTN